MSINQSQNNNTNNDSSILNYLNQENSNMNINSNENILISQTSQNKNTEKEKLVDIELKNIHMLILQRSLYILKKKFEMNKKPLEIIYQKYRDENYMKLKCVSVDYLSEVYNEVMETTQFTMIPYTNFNELFSADLMTEINKDKCKIIIKNLVKFTIENVEKYNRIYFEKKMKKRQLLEENKKKIHIVTSIDDMEEITNDKKIVRKNKRGEIIQNFDEILKNNVELKFGPEIIMTINEDDMSILNNFKLLYSDVIPLIIADFLQNYLKNNKNIALVSTSNISADQENIKLNQNVKNLFDNEILKFYQNISKLDPESERKEKLKNLLLDKMNTENQIKLYQKIILEQTSKGLNTKHLLNMVKKLNEQNNLMQKKINELSKNNLISVNNTDMSFNKENKKISEMNKSNSSLKGIKNNRMKLGNKNKSKLSMDSNNSDNTNKINNKDINKKNYHQLQSNYSNTDGSLIKININENENHLIVNNNNKNNQENFYYQYGVLYPETKQELRNNSLLEIFYFYTKQHTFIGQTPTFEQFLKSEENLDLAEFGKFCVEFKILVKPQKIAEIFKKTSENSKNLSYKKFCEALKKLSVCANDEKKKYLMDRIKIYEMKLKEINEKNKKNGNNNINSDELNNNNEKKEENLEGMKSGSENGEEGKCLDEKNLEEKQSNVEQLISDEISDKNKSEKNQENDNEKKIENNEQDKNKDNDKQGNNSNNNNDKEINKSSSEKSKEKTEKNKKIETTNQKYYQQSKLKNAKLRVPIVKKKIIKPKTSSFLISETKEDLEQKILKLKEDYNKLNQKTNTQLEEEFYQYLELDDISAYRKKMFGYMIPFRTKANYSRFPVKSVQNPPKQDPKIKKEMHKILVQRHNNLIKEKEMKQIKEKNILFEKRMKKFEEDKIKIQHKMSMKNDYLQMKKNEEDYQKEKINKLTWEQIQNCDYDTFILNEKDKNRNNFNDIFTSKSNQFEGDDADYLQNFKFQKGFGEENDKIDNNKNNNNNNKSGNIKLNKVNKDIPKFDSNLSRISSGNNNGSNSDLEIANAIKSDK